MIPIAWALLSALLSLRPALSLDATRAILLTALFLPLGASRVVGRSRTLLVSVFLAVAAINPAAIRRSRRERPDTIQS